MAEIPIPNNVVTEGDLAEWFTTKKELDRLKFKESTLRKRVVSAYFPNGVEGTNTFKLPDEFQLKSTFVINRSVDEALLQTLSEMFRENEVPVSDLIVMKPELVLKAYRALTEDKRHLFDQCLIIKEGTPQLKIDPPSLKKG